MSMQDFFQKTEQTLAALNVSAAILKTTSTEGNDDEH